MLESIVSKIIIIVLIIVAAIVLIRRSGSSKEVSEFNIAKGKEFLLENAKEVNIQNTESGIQYEVLTKGTGDVHPKASDKVNVHYHGTLIDGTVFDSSVERGEPISFGLNQVIKGWTEGVQLMVVGEKTRFFIPAELAYGNRTAGAIPAGSTLIFEVELLAINP